MKVKKIILSENLISLELLKCKTITKLKKSKYKQILKWKKLEMNKCSNGLTNHKELSVISSIIKAQLLSPIKDKTDQ